MDDLVIGGGADSVETYESVRVPKLHETPVLNSVSPTSKVSTSANPLSLSQ